MTTQHQTPEQRPVEELTLSEIAAEITTIEARYQLIVNTPSPAQRRHVELSTEYANRIAKQQNASLWKAGSQFSIGDDWRL